jgi:hypothetical protein
LENPAVAVATINTNINTDINYDTIGNFSVDLTDPNIIESRYNYKVQAKISEDSYGSVIFEREYALAPAGSGSAFPIGSIIAYMGNNSNIAGMAANGWFKCNGARIDTISALSADERTALTNILGGSTHLPDLRGNFLRGLDEGRGYDDDAGSRTGGESTTGVRSQQGESMRSHRHQASGSTNTDGDHGHNWRFGTSPDDDGSGSHDREYTKISGGFNALTSDNPIDSAGSAHSHSFSFTTGDPTTSSSGVVPVNGNENRPDNIAVYWLIRGR